ncbi:uncharacterized protein V2V93DRAFT_366536 [Kockiozyma suomiensis]|uniref:uncharacterized protein n=1 Tax=Kockiozyma suomiensis TaxID=1337062 RepID=UPI0033439833
MLRLPITRVARPLVSHVAAVSQRRTASKVAVSTPEEVALTDDEKTLSMQAPNRKETWAKSQKPRSEAMTGPRFAQHNLATQPQPYAAIDLIAQEPIRFIENNIAVCDGGRGVQGHPKVFINLDQDGPNTCTYCGLQYQMKHH